jgi:hypothetical protein
VALEDQALEDHIDVMLDEALEATFPASDPVAISTYEQQHARSQAHELA